ncbi:Pycsar system effector family protein [Flavobacterium sp.]|uniref:Pycsar system effector family protein n=1 Tax=Flavobacterium sp. TaxID=239 RepID=UPI0039E5AB0C
MNEIEKPKKNKKPKLERGVETLFRSALSNHSQLSQIADNKANILLSVNAIIISVALSSLVPKLNNPGKEHFLLPTFILIFSSVVSIIFAILSTRPKVSHMHFSTNDLNQRKVNLLFFGNFTHMHLEDFQQRLHEMIYDRDYLYDSLAQDLFLLGKVLQHKYRLLRMTYHVFMFGIVISVLSFLLPFSNL